MPEIRTCEFCGTAGTSVTLKLCAFETRVMKREVLELICSKCENEHRTEITPKREVPA